MFIGRTDGFITAGWANKQYEKQEELPDDDPEVVAFRNRPQAAELRRAFIESQIDGVITIAGLKSVIKMILTP